MKIININSNPNLKINFCNKNTNEPNKIKTPSSIVVDTITLAGAFTAYKNINKFTPVAKLFNNKAGKKTKALAIGASIITGMIANPLLTLGYKLAYPKEKTFFHNYKISFFLLRILYLI